MLLAVLLQAAAPAQQATPFFTNDQWGLLKILIVVVFPIILSILGGMWRMSKSAERADINGLGARIDAVHTTQTKLSSELANVQAAMGEDRLTFLSQLNERDQGFRREIGAVRETLGRLDERLSMSALIREAMRDARGNT